MRVAAGDPCTVDSAEADCPSADAGSARSDRRTGQTLESSIGGHDCGWVACPSNNHQLSIILHQFRRDCAGTYDCRFDALGSDAFLSKLETLLGRRVRPLPVGRPRKSKDHDARGRKVNNNR